MKKNVKIYSDNSFAKRFRTLMGHRNMTLQDIARATGNAVSTASTWRRGRVPRNGALEKLAKAFNVSAKYLIEGEESELFIFANEARPYSRDGDAKLKLDMTMRLQRLMSEAEKSHGGLRRLAARFREFSRGA